MPADPVAHLNDLIKKYTVFQQIPDIDYYKKITIPKKGSCSFRGCTEPIAWEDLRGTGYLCEGHYRTLKTWIEEARRGLVGGGHSALFSAD